jgi:hypothetical protein
MCGKPGKGRHGVQHLAKGIEFASFYDFSMDHGTISSVRVVVHCITI